LHLSSATASASSGATTSRTSRRATSSSARSSSRPGAAYASSSIAEVASRRLANGAGGELGPRLDTLDEDLDHDVESIVDPRHDIVEGFPPPLMPADFGDRLGGADPQARAAFVTAAAGG
jgi:hypothetical protein